jgi:hypothetical protein
MTCCISLHCDWTTKCQYHDGPHFLWEVSSTHSIRLLRFQIGIACADLCRKYALPTYLDLVNSYDPSLPSTPLPSQAPLCCTHFWPLWIIKLTARCVTWPTESNSFTRCYLVRLLHLASRWSCLSYPQWRCSNNMSFNYMGHQNVFWIQLWNLIHLLAPNSDIYRYLTFTVSLQAIFVDLRLDEVKTVER